MSETEQARRPVGRPPRINRHQIAEAALDIGLERVTMKSVAERLGVSVPGLYHHVRNKSELLRLAAQHTMRQLRIPPDRGQGWQAWLLAYAEYVHGALTKEPELVNQLLAGGIGGEREIATVERFLDVLERYDFSATEALEAYRLVSHAIVGGAVASIGRTSAQAEGRPILAELHRALARHEPDEHPRLRDVLAQVEPDGTDPLAVVRAVVDGISHRRGERSAAATRKRRGRRHSSS